MNKIALFYTIVFMAVSFVFSKNALHMFQQNRYEFFRYSKWLFNKNNIKFSLSAIYILVMLIALFIRGFIGYIIVLILSVLFAIYSIIKEDKEEYIKPLVVTARIKRTIVVLVIFMAVSYYFLITLLENVIGIMGALAIILPYLLIYPVALVLKPAEYLIKKH